MTWPIVPLHEVLDPAHGLQTGPFGSQLHASEYVADGVPVIMPRDLAGGNISTAAIARVPAEKAHQLEKYRVRRDDIVFARRGEMGRCALVGRAEDGWICGTGCLRARLGSRVLPPFLIQLMEWRRTVAWMKEQAVGQTMRNLNTAIVAQIPVRLPPLPAQRRIVEVLASIDAAMRSTRQLLDQVRVVREGCVRKLLRRGIGHALDGGVGAVPEGWRWMPVGELCTFVNGRGFKAAEWSARGLPIIRIQNLNGSRDFKIFGGEPKEEWIVDAGELLFAWAGVKGVSFGPRIWAGPRGVLNQHIYRVRPREGVAKSWLYECLRQVTRHIEERAQGFKASLLHLRKADITDQLVPVPPAEEQRAIAERSRSLAEAEAAELSHLEGLARLKRALMRDLFTGRRGLA